MVQQELSTLIRQAQASQTDILPLVIIPSQAFEPLVAPRRLERALRSSRVKKGYHYMPSRG
ncbi:hypothetical protein AAVH_36067 [Aphelenchoides avenae]|nr:hypothetical protein AAVH_36067 [Aphelenchus avenae]